MPQQLSNGEFLEGLSNLYDVTREAGSVWVTIKRGNFCHFKFPLNMTISFSSM